MTWRDSQLRLLGETRLYRARRRRAWLLLGLAISLTLTVLAARDLLG